MRVDVMKGAWVLLSDGNEWDWVLGRTWRGAGE